MSARERDHHLFSPGPKRILALDGGGVRGLITLGMLKRVEDILRAQSAEPETFRICHYFDLIGGTSTGAIIATLLALGETVDDITDLYFEICPKIFGGGRWIPGYWSKFDTKKFDASMKAAFQKVLIKNGVQPHEPTVGTDLLKTGLALVTKRIDTGSVWVQTNNPQHKFWDKSSEYWSEYWSKRPEAAGFHDNKNFELRKLAQASAAAPYYLDAIELAIGPDETGLFFDGAVSPFNNPSLELFLMTTLKSFPQDGGTPGRSPFGFGWETGANRLYMMSLGTGSWQNRVDTKVFQRLPAVSKGLYALRLVMADAEQTGVTLLQAFSDTSAGHFVDENLGTMTDLKIDWHPLLSYRRVNPTLSSKWLIENLGDEFSARQGFNERALIRMQQLDLAQKANLQRCHQIGLATGAKLINEDDFVPAFRI